jgi:hypothetical protein
MQQTYARLREHRPGASAKASRRADAGRGAGCGGALQRDHHLGISARGGRGGWGWGAVWLGTVEVA